MADTIIEFTTGEPGSGKSYRRCAHFLVNVLLNPKEAGPRGIWCNYPVRLDPWVDNYGVEHPGLIQFVLDKYGEEAADTVRDRVKVFPPEEVERWIPKRKEPIRGPWDFFEEEGIEDLGGWHVAIDEIHNFAPISNNKVYEAWTGWMGEIRHEGLTVEFLTQDPGEVNKAITKRAGVRRQLVKSIARRDPYLNIKLGDWYQLGTVFGKPYRPSVWEVEQRKVMSKWVTSDEMPFWFEPSLFGVYDSYSASNKTNRSGATAELAYQRFSKVGLLAWFFRRNGLRFIFNKTVPRVLFIVALYLLCSNYGTIAAYMSGQPAPVTEDKNGNGKLEEFEVDPDMLAIDRAKLELRMMEANNSMLVEKLIAALDSVDGIETVVGMGPGVVYLADGRTIGIGETIHSVTGEERTIKAVDYGKRQIVFDDGTVERYGSDFGMLDRVSDARNSASKLREVLQGSDNTDTSTAGVDESTIVR